MKILVFLAVAFAVQTAAAQGNNTLSFLIKNADTKLPVAEAKVSIKNSDISGVSDPQGRARLGSIPDGEQAVEITALGYGTVELKLSFPLSDSSERTVFIAVNNRVADITVNSTRTGREIEDEPTRIEAIDEEEIEEKINMRPGNVSMVLHESTGIQVQQTSATSNSQSVRIQGLDGRYTQILKDGFPSYGGFSGSQSVLEIPPLDLKQVEIIKGPSATLFGGSAIAGVINFVSKDPSDEPVTTLVLNMTSALGTDVSVFNSRRSKLVGYTLLGSANFQKAYDVDRDNFTELPATRALTVTPKLLFYLGERTTLTLGNSTSAQKRRGGNILAVRDRPSDINSYFEENRSIRNVTTFNLAHEFGGGRLSAKYAFAFFRRELETPTIDFRGSQFNSFGDISYGRAFGAHAIVAGGSFVFDDFRERSPGNVEPRNERRISGGIFLQDTFDITDRISVEGGLRLDRTRDYGTFALPRVSLLVRLTRNLSTRIGYGTGYKLPTMFTEEAETRLFKNVSGANGLKAERSRGGTFDINYRGAINDTFTYSINQMFFHTTIDDSVILRSDDDKIFRFSNAGSPVIARGIETNARLEYGIAKLFVGYTLTDAKAGYLPGTRRLTLTPMHRINSALVFERRENYKFGAEFYFASRQTLENRALTRRTGEIGLFAEKTIGNFSLFINGENL
ncbi:MAG: TonB-dependent receptor, partial [Pyrinomonadaceae bacterium]|nr:TonB-dependent receptor [Pyrinomonadaceae bacterium]